MAAVRKFLVVLAMPYACETLSIRDLDAPHSAKFAVESKQAPHEDEAKAKQWWDTGASEQFQHTNRTYVQAQYPEWNEKFISKFTWASKRVVDYGIGGGYLGEVLFKWHAISTYVGVDISQRSLDKAAEVLAPWHGRFDLRLTPQVFSSLKPDIFVTQQVIQHFPSEDYLVSFLQNVDSCGAKQLMLHFRRSANGTTAANDAYGGGAADQGKVTFALTTSVEAIASHLPHYRLSWQDEAPMYQSVGVFSGWELVAH